MRAGARVLGFSIASKHRAYAVTNSVPPLLTHPCVAQRCQPPWPTRTALIHTRCGPLCSRVLVICPTRASLETGPSRPNLSPTTTSVPDALLAIQPSQHPHIPPPLQPLRPPTSTRHVPPSRPTRAQLLSAPRPSPHLRQHARSWPRPRGDPRAAEHTTTTRVVALGPAPPDNARWVAWSDRAWYKRPRRGGL